MENIWLDVTTISAWQRPPVGVVRVELECASFALDNLDLKVRFCIFSMVEDQYQEVSSEELRETLDRIYNIGAFDKSQAAKLLPPSTMSFESRITSYFLRTIDIFPRGIRHFFFGFAKKRRKSTLMAIRACRELGVALCDFIWPSSYCANTENRAPPHGLTRHIPFASDDVYISVGLDWDQKNLPYLFSEKRRVGFTTLLFCYDVIPVKFPHLCVGDVSARFSKYFADLAWCADNVLCISDCSKKDLTQLLKVLGTPAPRMEVVKLGSNILPYEQAESDAVTGLTDILERKFILFVSTIERRKNHETIYRAYLQLIDAGVLDLPLLVFIGMPGWGVTDMLEDLRLDPRITPYIRIFNNVSDADLSWAYHNAYFTVFPSLYEGWGLPVAESLAHGKFCLASNAGSLPEVGGDLIDYVDPWDVPEWAAKIEFYIKNPRVLLARETKIKSEYKVIQWGSCAASVFESAIGMTCDEYLL
jgi:glycosyltransferase involved in cell wall biosynthesis